MALVTLVLKNGADDRGLVLGNGEFYDGRSMNGTFKKRIDGPCKKRGDFREQPKKQAASRKSPQNL
ncbi:MAG: hypothetical protein AB1847_10530 [bacterium]